MLEKTVKILDEADVREMTLTRFIPCGLGQSSLELATNPEVFFQAIDALRSATSQRGISLLLANATPSCRLPAHQRDLCNRCSFGFDRFYVDVRGNVLTCGMARISLGNLFATPLRDLLRASKNYRDFRELNHIPQHCRLCPELSECGGGCRAAALASQGHVAADDPFCFTT
jgi:radical SAM protein with 4Fe4S-binding SPASM domain